MTLSRGPWYAIVDDMIGGYAIGNRDKPVSEYSRASDDRIVANFVTGRGDAEFIARARNTLTDKLLDMLADDRYSDELIGQALRVALLPEER